MKFNLLAYLGPEHVDALAKMPSLVISPRNGAMRGLNALQHQTTGKKAQNIENRGTRGNGHRGLAAEKKELMNLAMIQRHLCLSQI